MRTLERPISISPRNRRRSGLALVLVLMVMALVAIMGYAMLAGSALQATASSNGIAAAVADAQAESGIHLAMYYLLNPSNAPTLTNGYWPGATGITFATIQPSNTATGSVDVAVAAPTGTVPNYYYTVTSTGYSGSTPDTGVKRTIVAQVELTTQYAILQAATLNANISVNSGATLSGSPNAIRSSAQVKIAGGTVSGNAIVASSGSFSLTGGSFSGQVVVTPSNPPAPTPSDLHDYSTYTYQGVSYAAQPVSSPLSGVTLGPTASNPLGVYIYAPTGSVGTLIMQNNNVINGTLLVNNAKLSVQGKSNTITAGASMPALLINQQLEMNGLNRGLSVTGAVFANNGVTGVGSTSLSNLTINGALLINSTGVSGYSGTLKVTYSSGNASVPNLSTANQVPESVKLVSWTPL